MVMFNIFLSFFVLTFSIIEEEDAKKSALCGEGGCEDKEVNRKYFDTNICQK